MKVTMTVDIGEFVGHPDSHPEILEKARGQLAGAKAGAVLIDFCVTKCGDDLQLIMTHNKGVEDSPIHKLAWDTLTQCTELVRELKLYGAGQGGSHHGPLIPVSNSDATPSRFDGPPRVAGIGFQLANGKLIGPRDLLADIAFDNARKQARDIADYLRCHGPFEPHCLSLDEMEYTGLPEVMSRLEGRFNKFS